MQKSGRSRNSRTTANFVDCAKHNLRVLAVVAVLAPGESPGAALMPAYSVPPYRASLPRISSIRSN